jgi:hypothetical protein
MADLAATITDQVALDEQTAIGIGASPDLNVSSPVDSASVQESVTAALDLNASTVDQIASGESVSAAASLADIAAVDSIASEESVSVTMTYATDLYALAVDSGSISESLLVVSPRLGVVVDPTIESQTPVRAIEVLTARRAGSPKTIRSVESRTPARKITSTTIIRSIESI